MKMLIICTPIGWLWGWLHCNYGYKPGWVFPLDAYSNIEFFGMILEDWLFYPITGGFFVTIVLFDPLKKILPFDSISFGSYWIVELLNKLMTVSLAILIFCSVFFEFSGKITALFFGVPSLCVMLWYQSKCYYNPGKFLRTLIIVAPTEFLWDHWAVGKYQQWIYLKDSGIFNLKLFFNGIPIEMTPYLGIISAYFVFVMTMLLLSLEGKHAEKNI